MFEPDEYIFTKLAYYFKGKKKRLIAQEAHAVLLTDISSRLSLIARALTGNAIEIYQAEREGGYKNNSFFLPERMAQFPSYETNLQFYVFRLLFLTIQQELDFNWSVKDSKNLQESREKAVETATVVLEKLAQNYPIAASYHEKIKSFYQLEKKDSKDSDLSFVYGKWMQNKVDTPEDTVLNNFTDKVKKATEELAKTLLKNKGVEEIISVQIDQKQLDDAVLQHQFEKVETADEFGGNWRDMDGDDELEDHANALEDLNMKYTVRVDDTAHSVYQSDFMENTTISESASSDNKGFFLNYDEWDYKKRTYKPKFCKVYPKILLKKEPNYYQETLNKNKNTLLGLRKMLSAVNNKYQQQRRQPQGDHFDLEAVTDRFIALKAGVTPSENVYLSSRKKEKDLSILLLLDVSLSSDGYVAGNRVIDIEKQTAILFGEILNEFNIDFAIDCFYSKTRNHATYITAKDFDASWSSSKDKIGAIDPAGYTRIGTALRHAGARLDGRNTKNKWIILLSDGKPNDYDRYEGTYGIKDVNQALKELNQRKINSYALAIEAQAKYYLPQMFGKNHYQILSTPETLIQSLVQLYERIKHQT